MDDEIAALLRGVTNKTGDLAKSNGGFAKFLQEEDAADAVKRAASPEKGVADLPPQLKMLVLSYVDDKLRSQSLRTPNHLKLPAVNLSAAVRDPASLKILKPNDLKSIDEAGFVVKDNFMNDPALIEQILLNANDMLASGVLKPAGMNQGTQQWRDTKVRGDLHAWVNDIDRVRLQWPALATLLQRMDEIRLELNAAGDFNCTKTQTQVACYPGEGARYIRHLDSFQGGTNRRLTCLYYMNKDWKPADGGQLQLFLPDPQDPTGEQEITKHIEPLADRLLIFQSRVIEHEVLPSHIKRFSITLWFY